MTQKVKTVRPRKEAYGDLDFAGWETGWMRAVVEYLKGLDRGAALGSLTLAVIGVACCTVSSPAVLVSVVSIAAAFSTLVILTGR